MLIPTNVDALVLTEYNPVILAPTSVTAGVDALVITEYNPVVYLGFIPLEVVAGVDALVITTFNPTISPVINVPLDVLAGCDILRLTEYSAEVTHSLPELAKEIYATSRMKKELKSVSEMEY